MTKQFYVYILSSKTRTTYTGMTNNLERRMFEHKNHTFEGFSKQHGTNKLVYFETYHDVRDAIAHEKQIKSWRREKKENLIELKNPDWDDLSTEWLKKD